MRKVFSWRIWAICSLALALVVGASTSQGQLELKEIEVCTQGPPRCLTASIQVAVNAVAEGGLVKVMPGEYQENVIIDKSLTLRGFEAEDRKRSVDSMTTTLLIAKYPELPALTIEAKGVTIENLVLRGHGDPQWKREREKGVIHIRGTSQNIHISHNRIEAEEIGIGIMQRSQEIYIEENLIIAPYHCVPGLRGFAALVLEEAEAVYIRKNTLLAREGAPIWVHGGDSIEIVENSIGTSCFPELTIRGGILIVAGGRELEELQQGLPSRRMKVIGNTIFGPGIVGITAGNFIELEVVNNYIFGPWVAGIQAFALNLTIRRNTVASGGIGILAWGGLLQLEDNVVVNIGWAGIIVGTKKEQQGELKLEGRAILQDNIVAHAAGYGIALSVPQCVIEDLKQQWPGLAEPFGFEGELIGESNLIVRANKGDLCPTDYPWPARFKK